MLNSMEPVRLVTLSRLIISLAFLLTTVHNLTDLDNRECLKDIQGMDYIGTKAISKSGLQCKTWTSWNVTNGQLPNDRSVREAKNYCRYFDNTPPLCYVADKKTANLYWQPCNISLCSTPICTTSPCVCVNGYELSSDKSKCSDIDECSEPEYGCLQNGCTNTIGNYSCTICQDWYKLTENKCIDVDECTADNGTCEQICINTPGSYRCQCVRGYQLNDDQINCSDINECSANNGGCEDNCNNSDGSYHCSCRDGFISSINKNSCYDIDECESKKNGCQQNCINTIGSYTCSCYDEYVTDINDLRLCMQSPILPIYIRREVFFGCLGTLLVICISVSLGWLIYFLYKRRKEHDAALMTKSSDAANNPRKSKNVIEVINLEVKEVTGADYEALAEHKKPRFEETVYQQLENNMYDEVHK